MENTNTIQTPETTTTAPVRSFDEWITSADDATRQMVENAIKDRTHKANSEAKNLRETKKNVESTIAKIKARFEVDDLTDDFLDELQRLPTEKLSADERAKTYERKWKEIEAERNKYKDELTTTQKKIAEKSRDESIMSALGKVGIRSEAIDSARKIIALDAALNEDGEWVYSNKNLSDYLGEWTKSNSYMLSNPVNAGAGNARPVTSAPTFDIDFYNRQSPEYQKAHANEFFDAMKKGLIK